VSDKTLGQILFDKVRDLPALQMTGLMPWRDQPPHIQDAWQAAAEAVVKQTWKRGMAPCPACGAPSKSQRIESLDCLPPQLTNRLRCANDHEWFVCWEGE
jgi:hypothetical protein